MTFKIIIHSAEEGGYWAEVPAIPGCFSQGETYDETIKNIQESIEAVLMVEIKPSQIESDYKVVELVI